VCLAHYDLRETLPVHPFQRFSSWLLVVLGALLLVSGSFALVGAIINHDWAAAVVTLLLLGVVAFGTLRGIRQVRHRDTGEG
jgi:uncharacterized membrane protein HdeD (DUF308 family)